MLVTRAVERSWLRASMILYHRLAACGQRLRSMRSKPNSSMIEQVETGVEADAVVDGLIGHRGGEIFEEFAAGDVVDGVFEQARGQADALDAAGFSPGRIGRRRRRSACGG